ncbi:MAG: serine hydrolase [Ekhidna sp.]
MNLFKITIASFVLICSCRSSISQKGESQFYEKIERDPGETIVYPDEHWTYSSPENFGYSIEAFKGVKKKFEAIGGEAMIVVKNGYVIASFGDVEVPIPNFSIRKSFLNSLLGMEYDKGNLNLKASLTSLGMDDRENLTSMEKNATIEQLLRASSGVYHPANHESSRQKNDRPPRGSHKPGDFFYYNNWDFNALGSIYMQESGNDLFEAFRANIAEKIGMQDFSVKNTKYENGSSSKHPAYTFKTSARDDARFGLLYLNKGKWNDESLLSEEWINKSLSLQATTGEAWYYDYGYLWWVDTRNNMFMARGKSGQYIALLPNENMVIVFRADPGSIIREWIGTRVKPQESMRLILQVLNAKKND